MATYTELRGIFDHGELRNRIEVACVVAATAIRSEDAGTTNHANRLVWARHVFSEPSMMSKRMHMALLGTNAGATVATITGVTDANLQTLVNAAVDTFADGS